MDKHKYNLNQIINFTYIFLLLFVVTSTVLLGAIVAPVIFNSGLYLDNVEMTRFENGLLMSEVFRRFSNLLNIVLLATTIYHSYYYKEFLSSIVTIISFALFAVSSLLFSFYFTEGIFSFIQKGEDWINDNIELFEAFHKASEIDFMIIMFSAFVLCIIAFKKKYHP